MLASIEEQGKLTDDLKDALLAADTKARVEDIYLPSKPKRRTKAQIAREAGLGRSPTACCPTHGGARRDCVGVPERRGGGHLEGARRRAPHPGGAGRRGRGIGRQDSREVLGRRDAAYRAVVGRSRQSAAAQKFRDYFDYSESLEDMPSHRVLAVMRGEKEEVLSLKLEGGDEAAYQHMIAQALGIDLTADTPATPWLAAAAGWAWRTRFVVGASVDARICCASGPRTTPWRYSPRT